MSRTYRYVQRYLPGSESRVELVVEFLSGTQSLRREPHVYDGEGGVVPVTTQSIGFLMRRRAAEIANTICGVDFELFSGPGAADEVSRYDFHIGTKPGELFVDFMAMQAGRSDKTPDIDAIVKLTGIGTPCEAFLAELNNEFELGIKKRQSKIPACARPAAIRPIHFLGQNQVKSLGGEQFCLKAPVYRASACNGGVLLEVIAEPFDSANGEHLKAQSLVMQYFGC